MIGEDAAWEILRKYVEDCLIIDAQSLLAVFATGSLPAGYYRPGQSDIDVALIVRDGSETIWGTCIKPSLALEELNRCYLETYRIPKDFGPFPIQEWELYPPYDAEKELAPEIARLKLQGRCVYGSLDLDRVPMPTAEDFLQYAQHFEEWWRSEFSRTMPIENLSTVACVNTILTHLHRFLCIKRDVSEFDKRKLVRTYQASDPPFVDVDIFWLVESSLAGGELTEEDSERLRTYTAALRLQMNAYLGIG